MRPARDGFDDLGLAAARDDLVRLAGVDLPEAEVRRALDDEELLGLGVVVVLAARDAGSRP